LGLQEKLDEMLIIHDSDRHGHDCKKPILLVDFFFVEKVVNPLSHNQVRCGKDRFLLTSKLLHLHDLHYKESKTKEFDVLKILYEAYS
jgi:hypothetical protein